MDIKIIDNELFLKKLYEFNNTEDVDKKYQKGLKLINDIDKVKETIKYVEEIFS